MSRPLSRAALLLAAICTMAPHAALTATRDVVERIATLIENNYFDADKATDIARQLRAAERAGEFRALSDPRDLAAALTSRLKPVDQHFNVTWLRAAPSQPLVNGASQPSGRRASGLRSVELLPGGLGYIDLRFFTYIDFKNPDDPARLAADAALQMTADASALILDLRNNGGGWPEMVGYFVSAFVPADAAVYNVVRRRDGTESERPAELYRAPRTDIPLFVLVSGGTASAAESAAYTLQAAKRALVIGERTLGAANPGGEFPVGEGFNIFISTGTPLNPFTGANWEGVGVKPDVEVDAQQALTQAQILALQKLLESRPDATDLKWALEALHAESKPTPAASVRDYAGTYAGASITVSGNALQLRRERRLPLTLVRLRDDIFFVSGDPLRRVNFERDPAGRIRGFQLVRANGPTAWHPRERGQGE
jgi:hypothetical protein